MSKTNLSVLCNRSRDTESLKTFTDGCGSLGSLSCALLDGDGSTYCVSPACILETDWLNALNHAVYIKTCVFCDLLSFFDRSDTITV